MSGEPRVCAATDCTANVDHLAPQAKYCTGRCSARMRKRKQRETYCADNRRPCLSEVYDPTADRFIPVRPNVAEATERPDMEGSFVEWPADGGAAERDPGLGPRTSDPVELLRAGKRERAVREAAAKHEKALRRAGLWVERPPVRSQPSIEVVPDEPLDGSGETQAPCTDCGKLLPEGSYDSRCVPCHLNHAYEDQLTEVAA
jgi:hypothetical protein